MIFLIQVSHGLSLSVLKCYKVEYRFHEGRSVQGSGFRTFYAIPGT